jgi:hypothetical protein
MTRRKSEITARRNEREAPHIVELAFPDGALGLHYGTVSAILRRFRFERCHSTDA